MHTWCGRSGEKSNKCNHCGHTFTVEKSETNATDEDDEIYAVSEGERVQSWCGRSHSLRLPSIFGTQRDQAYVQADE